MRLLAPSACPLLRASSLVALVSLLSAGCWSLAGGGARPWRPRPAPELHRYLDLPRATAPSLSEDGRRVAFLSDAPGLPQPFLVETGGAAPVPPERFVRLARTGQRAQFVHLVAGGKLALLGQDQGGDENTQLSSLDLASGGLVALTTGAKVRNLFGFLDARRGRLLAYSSNARNGRDFDVYLRDLDADQGPRLVLEARGHVEPRALSDDGKALLLVEKRSGSDESLHWLPLDPPGAKPVALFPHQGEARLSEACLLGPVALALSDAGREFLSVDAAFPDLPALAPERYVAVGRDVEALACAQNHGKFAVAINVGGGHELRLFRLGAPPPPGRSGVPAPFAVAGFPRPIETDRKLPPGVIRHLHFSGDGSRLAIQLGRSTEPDQLWTIHTDTGATEQLTRSSADLDALPRVEPTVESLASFDGERVSMFVYRPRLGPGERAPALVWVHGGPEAQFQPSFSPMIQALVARGHVVVAPNVRGSTGQGKRFSHLDDVGKREDSVRDLAEVNRWLRAQPYVLGDRIAVMGGSYGGYMVLASLTLYPELWSAGVDVVGIANFRSFLEKTAPYRRAQREAEYGRLDADGALLDRLSPLHRVDRIRAPLFVIHGANDPRVPVQEAEQIVEALRRRSHPVTYLRFEDEGHGLSRRENQLSAYEQVMAFLDGVASR